MLVATKYENFENSDLLMLQEEKNKSQRITKVIRICPLLMSVWNLIANQPIFKYLILDQSGEPTDRHFDL